MLDDIARSVALAVPCRIPVMALSEEFDVAQAGASYERYGQDAACAAAVHVRAVERMGYDWSCVYIDDCLEFEPLGVKTRGSENVPRAGAEFLRLEPAEIGRLAIPDPRTAGRMPVLLEAVRRIRGHFGDSPLVCGRTPAPFSAATLLLGIPPVLLMALEDQRLLRHVMDFLIDVEEEFARAQVEAGAHALWVGDCVASSRFISPECYRDVAMGSARELLGRLRGLGALTIYYNAEKASGGLPQLGELGADIVALSEEASLESALAALGGTVCVMGNLDPLGVLRGGSPSDVRAAAGRILSRAGSSGGFLFNTGEGVPRDTPPENMEALVAALREFATGS